MSEKCVCHINGYRVKDSVAREEIENAKVLINAHTTAIQELQENAGSGADSGSVTPSSSNVTFQIITMQKNVKNQLIPPKAGKYRVILDGLDFSTDDTDFYSFNIQDTLGNTIESSCVHCEFVAEFDSNSNYTAMGLMYAYIRNSTNLNATIANPSPSQGFIKRSGKSAGINVYVWNELSRRLLIRWEEITV